MKRTDVTLEPRALCTLIFAHRRDGVRVEEKVPARITWTEQRAGFMYFGYVPLDQCRHGVFGAAALFRRPRPYGLQRVEAPR